MDHSRYPVDWKAIATTVKDAAGWECQACGKPCRRPDEPFRGHQDTLTVAHWDHDTEADAVFVVALCAPCHLRHDAPRKARQRVERRWHQQALVTP